MSVLWASTNSLCHLCREPAPSIASSPSLTGKDGPLKLCLFFVLIATAVLGSSAVFAERSDSHLISHDHEEHSLARTFAHVSEFSWVSAFALALPKCASVRQPEALLTPDPVFPPPDGNPLVGVSFIVGSDGHVHSAFVIHSGGTEGDQAVLRAIRGWRYRPALCNGVPTDSEARVRFSVHE